MFTALNKLGYKSYHATEVTQNLHLVEWNEGLEAKVTGNGKPFGREEFDKLLGSYSVSMLSSLTRLHDVAFFNNVLSLLVARLSPICHV